MESRLIVVVVFVCAVCYLTEAQQYTGTGIYTATALTTSISNSTCRTNKLCVSDVTSCNPSGNSSCFFSSTQVSNGVLTVEISGTTSGYVALGLTPANPQTTTLTQGPLVFVCGNNNTIAFLETATRSDSVLTTVIRNIINSNINNVQGSITGNQSLNQSLTQCTFNINLTSIFLTSTLINSNILNSPITTLINSPLLNSTLVNSTTLTLLNSSIINFLNSTRLNSGPFYSILLPFLNSTLVNSTLINSTLYDLFNSSVLNLNVQNLTLLNLLSSAPLNTNQLTSNLLTFFNFTPLYNSLSLLNANLNSTQNSTLTSSTIDNLFNSLLQIPPFSSFTLLSLFNSTLISVPAQLPFNITILNGTTNGTQLGNASNIFNSNGPLDLANPRSNVPVPVLFNITRTGCNSTKLCLSSGPGCDPAGNGSCFFSSVRLTNQTFFFELSGTTAGYVALGLTQNGATTVFACGNYNYVYFFQPATQNGASLTPATVNTVYNNVGVVAQNQTLIQCLFNTSTSFNISTRSPATNYQVTVLNGNTTGFQLGPATTLYDSKTPLDLSNPNALNVSSSTTILCTNVLAVLLSALTLHVL